MKNNRIQLITCLSLLAFSFSINAKENVGPNGIISSPNSPSRSVMSGCAPATARVDLDINNVRATLLNGGDMWWDLISAQYEVPKGSKIKSLFAGSLWIGGIDASNQLKVAAMTYRQTGNDYWPGPLTSAGTIDAATCLQYDKFYKVDRADVEAFHNWGGNGPSPLGSSEEQAIRDWPTVGPEGQPLAPFFDSDGDGIYNPDQGDYPDFDLVGNRACSAKLKGDQAIWWVFNDKGNVHTETGGASIGLEIQAQAFAFATNDEINDMTFYTYRIANKSSFSINKTHFGVWVDADLGGYNDDYVGCDVSNGFGYTYNGDAIDEGLSGVLGYGANPPACGVDFFEGPYADSNGVNDPADSTINGTGYGDVNPLTGVPIIDNERLGMERFIYYNNNTNPINGNPNNSTDFYNYLTGKWQDNSPMTYGGDAVGAGTPCKFVFPDDSDPTGYGTNHITQAPWSEWRENNPFVDRRFMQVAGPFTLRPGAVNVITTGVVWARATQGGPMASLALLKGADKKAQKLFNNCFKTLDGPTAPDLAVQELDNELILTWTNPRTSNNFQENYSEDPDLAVGGDSLYRFQGYQIYQLKDATVSSTELNNVDRARLVLQCDKKDGIKQIVNYNLDQTISAIVPQEMVNGTDAGVVHSTSVKTDLFAPGNNALVNHKTYYYTIVAYGYSSTQQFNSGLFSLADYMPYLAGRKNVHVYTAIPHIVSPELNGTEQHSDYGSGIKLKRIEGQGNGGNVLDITSGSVAEILNSSANRSLHPVYESGHGPVSIKVVDPLNVPNENFRIYLTDTSKITTPASALSDHVITTKAQWVIVKLPGGNRGDTIYSESSIVIPNEQLINGQSSGVVCSSSQWVKNCAIPRWGISVNVVYTYDPANALAVNNGALASDCSLTFGDVTKRWFTGLPDQDGTFDQNWIRSGTAVQVPAEYNDYSGVDNNQNYETMINGTWAPYRLCAFTTAGTPLVCRGGPAWDQNISLNSIKNLASVDVIFTADKSKWTRCPVIELQEEAALAIGGAKKMSMRKSLSVDKNGKKAGDAGYNANEGGTIDSAGVKIQTPTGMGWFPGYAINLETGERLNMAFGEDSYLPSENGTDMIWNPSANTYSNSGDPLFGGKHYIYVFGHNGNALYTTNTAIEPNIPGQLKDIPRYDGGLAQYKLYKAFENTGTIQYKREIYTDAMWVSIPLRTPGHSLFESDAKVRLRVSRSYQKYGTGTPMSFTNLVVGQNYFVEVGPIKHAGITYNTGAGFTAVATTFTDTISAASITSNYSVLSTVNNANGMYEFSTADVETHTNDEVSAKDALDLINVVPNPYYAYSGYEKTTLDNIVKITNIPSKCTISIYTLNGNLVRRFKKDESGAESKTSLDWDLKNEARIPVASGMYIIHVEVPGVGEKILKWFGVMRPIDIEAY